MCWLCSTYLFDRQIQFWCLGAPASSRGSSVSRSPSHSQFLHHRTESICLSFRLLSCAQLSSSFHHRLEPRQSQHFAQNWRNSLSRLLWCIRPVSKLSQRQTLQMFQSRKQIRGTGLQGVRPQFPVGARNTQLHMEKAKLLHRSLHIQLHLHTLLHRWS